MQDLALIYYEHILTQSDEWFRESRVLCCSATYLHVPCPNEQCSNLMMIYITGHLEQEKI